LWHNGREKKGNYVIAKGGIVSNYFHKIKKNKKKLVSAGVVLAVLLQLPALDGLPGLMSGSLTAWATAEHEQIKNEAQDNLDDVNDKIDDVQDASEDLEEEIAANKAKRKKLEQKISDANDELDEVMDELDDLKNQISAKQTEIEQAAVDLVEAKDELDKEYEAMKLRIQFMYENNQQDSFWSAILDSDGLVDMLTRVEYIADVYASDRKLMIQYQDTLQQVEDLNTKLAQDMEELVALQEESESKQRALEDTIASLEADEEELASLISDQQAQQKSYESQLAKYEQKKEEYQQTISEQEEIIRQLEAAAAQQDAATYEGGGTGQSNTLGSAEYLKDDSYNPSPVTDVSGADVVAYAVQFVGNPYKWGGNSLTEGADCSGFVHQVFKHFGIDTPRYSQSFKSSGQAVSYNNMQAGDVVVYDGHVAIYMGNGKIVEAQSTKAGITNTRSVDCHKITAIRRLV
jgi:cell wall-associated NlpC family hydrolase